MLAQMAIGMIAPLLPSFVASIGLSSSGVGLIVAMPSVARLVLNLPLGALVDVVGRKRPLVIGSLVEALGSLGTALAHSLSALLPPRLLVGAGSATATTAGTAYTMDVVDRYPEHRGLLLGTMQAALTLAFAAGPACGGILAQRSGSATLPFCIIAAILALSAPAYALLPETRGAVSAAAQKKTASSSSSSPRNEPPAGLARVSTALAGAACSFRELLKQPEQQALMALRFGLICGWSAWLTVLPLQASAAWGATAGDLGTMYSVIALLGFVSAPIGGRLADRFGRVPVIAAGSATSALAIGALPWCASKAAFYAMMGVWDVGEAMLTAAATALGADVTPEDQRGAQASLGNQVQDMTFVVMPVLLGAVAAARSNAVALWLTAGCMCASNALFAARMRAA